MWTGGKHFLSIPRLIFTFSCFITFVVFYYLFKYDRDIWQNDYQLYVYNQAIPQSSKYLRCLGKFKRPKQYEPCVFTPPRMEDDAGGARGIPPGQTKPFKQLRVWLFQIDCVTYENNTVLRFIKRKSDEERTGSIYFKGNTHPWTTDYVFSSFRKSWTKTTHFWQNSNQWWAITPLVCQQIAIITFNKNFTSQQPLCQDNAQRLPRHSSTAGKERVEKAKEKESHPKCK